MFKFLLLGAFTLSLGVGFVGCKNYDDEIDDICIEIEAMKGQIAELQRQIGGDGATYFIDAELDGSTLVLERNDGAPVRVDLSNLVSGEASLPKLSGNATEGYTLSVWDEPNDKWVDVKIPTADTLLNKIDILGWTSGFGAGDQTISLGGAQDADTPGIATALDGEFDGINATGVSYIERGDPFVVTYSWLEQFDYDKDNSGDMSKGSDGIETDATDIWNENVWTGGKHRPVLKSVLNTLEAEKKGIVVEVFPASTDMELYTFELKNSEGDILPITWGTPKKINGLMTTTRSANANALWFIPGTYDDTKEWPTEGDYTVNYNTDKTLTSTPASATAARFTGTPHKGVYAFYFKGGAKVSEYTPFHFAVNQIDTTFEGPVETISVVGDEEDVAKYSATGSTNDNPPHTGGGDGEVQGYYTVKARAWYEVSAFGANAAADAANESDKVVDYILDLDEEELEKDEFQVELSSDKTAFRVNRIPDNLTMAMFDIRVYKLTVDGTIYTEDVNIYPFRESVKWVKSLGDYFVNDVNTKGVAATSGDNKTKMSQKMVVDLDEMLTWLSGQTYDVSNYKNLWQDDEQGAKSYRISKLVITDDGGIGAGSVKGTYEGAALDLWVEALGDNGGDIAFFAETADAVNYKEDGTGTSVRLSTTMATGTVWKAHSMVFAPPYAIEGDATNAGDVWPYNITHLEKPDLVSDVWEPAFEIGSKYTVTYDFLDEDDNVLTQMELSFTPRIPDLGKMVEKQAGQRWNADQTVLRAFYKDPEYFSFPEHNDGAGAGAAARDGGNRFAGLLVAVNGTRYDIAVSEYTGHYSDGKANAGLAGGDGGFSKLGGEGTDTEWANLAFALPRIATGVDTDKTVQKIGGQFVDNTTVAEALVVYPTETNTGWVVATADLNDSTNGTTDFTPKYDAYFTAAAAAAYWTGRSGAADMARDNIFTLQGQFLEVAEVNNGIDWDKSDVHGLGDNDGVGEANAGILVPIELVRMYDAAGLLVGDNAPVKTQLNALPYSADAYGQEVNVEIGLNYLDVYALKDKENFKIKMMSALREGTIIPFSNGAAVDEIELEPAGGVFVLDNSKIKGIKYSDLESTNPSAQYNIFSVYNAGLDEFIFDYTYVAEVEFLKPTDLVASNDYYFVGLDKITTLASPVVEITGDNDDADATIPDESCLFIKPGNTSQDIHTTLLVRVTDRFGRVLQVPVPIFINNDGSVAPVNP